MTRTIKDKIDAKFANMASDEIILFSRDGSTLNKPVNFFYIIPQ
jgi:hypothetical protein